MATNHENTPAAPGEAPLLQTLAAHSQQVGIALLIVGAAVVAVPVLFAYYQHWPVAGVEIIWSAALALSVLAAGAVCLLLRARDDFPMAEQLRMTFLALGGVAGFLIASCGLIVPFTHYSEVFAGGLQEWSKNSLIVWSCSAAVVVGLALMFASLLLARSVERTNMLMRRLLYGYNAVLASFLLFTVLLLINVLGYSPLPAFGALKQTYDWTANQVFSISDATRSQLAAVKKPVRVILLLPGRSRILPAMETLLRNCEGVQPNLAFEAHDPELMDPDDRDELQRRYSLPREDIHGMLVIYGKEPDATSTFVKQSELFQDTSAGMFEEEPSSSKKFVFKGEAALTTALDYLEGGKVKAVIYFTQGNGELEFGPGVGGEARDSMSTLVDALGHGNFELKPLEVTPTLKEIPSDASVVVIARPRTPLPDAALSALRSYLKGANGKPGRLVVLANHMTAAGAVMDDPGLDGLLAEYDVKTGKNRVLQANQRIGSPTQLLALPDPAGGNPVARQFAQSGELFLFQNAQTVEAQHTNPEFRAAVLLQALPQFLVWTVTDPRADVSALAKDARKEASEGKMDRFSTTPLPLAVVVSQASGAPPIPGHEFMGPQPGKPVMAVFGDASWISDDALQTQFADADFSLFKSTLEWLREKADIGQQVKTKSGAERDEFSMEKVTPASGWNIEVWAPLVLLCGVLALGLGIAVVRRS
jgi:hypothetical protein